jgi:AcrR family transcriptional regulator
MDGRRGLRRGGKPPAAMSAPSPRGALERERVAEIQRARMLTAMTELAHECGARQVTVAHVVTRAGVSRRTFYELFEDREDCLLAALDRGSDRITAAVVPAYEGEAGWSDRIRSGLTALLELFDEEPATAVLCVVAALGAGPEALRRRARVLEAAIDAVEQGRREAPATAGLSRLTAEGIVGAVLGVLHTRLLEPNPKPLSGLRGQMMSMIVLPYLGPEAAAAELNRRAPNVRRARAAREDPLRSLDMRLTYRTMRVLTAIGANPGLSNRQVARAAGVTDQGQISKLLARLESLGLIGNTGHGLAKGEPNAWSLTLRGEELEQAIHARVQR